MFVQIIKAKATDPEGLRRQDDDWEARLQAGATGYLGVTGGTTDDGELIQIVRFESEEAARRNSERPEQGEWWEQTSQYLENPTFTDSSDVAPYLGGGSDDAGFVQIIEATVTDRARYEELMKQFEARAAADRPDLLGGLTIWHGDNELTMVGYFTSEAEARAGEAKEMPEEMKALDEEWRSLISDVRFYDLKEPKLSSA